MIGQSRMQMNRVPPIGHSARFERAVSQPQMLRHEHTDPSTSQLPTPQYENAVTGPSKHRYM